MAATTDPVPVVLRIGRASLPLTQAEPQAVTAAVEAANQPMRLDGVPDVLNPGLIDPVKAGRFVAGLRRQPAETLARMAGHQLALLDDGLGLSTAAPTHGEAYAGPFTVTVDDASGAWVTVHTSVTADAALAQSRAAQAQAALREAEAALQSAEAAKAGGERLTALRQRRSAVAVAWRMNATAWAAAAQDPAAQAAKDAARKAAGQYEMPSGGLL